VYNSHEVLVRKEVTVMSDRKALFFDIDGTIWNVYNEIPESTVRAMHCLHENGHKIFLCSGRTKAYIHHPKLLDIGFDGIISGCGTMIEYGGKTVLYKKLDTELVAHTIKTVRKYGMRPILEGRTYLYLDDSDFADDDYGEKLRAEMGDRLRSIAGDWGMWEISKLSCATEEADRETCYEALAEYYDCMIHDSTVTEFVPKGYHKGTGIKAVCEGLGLDISDTFAFGDGANDVGMMRTAGVGIAMGNGSEVVKASADYVTAPMDEDGIWKACKHFKLI
jgi:hypothetical protein